MNKLESAMRRFELVDWVYLVCLLSLGPMIYVQCYSLWQRPHFQFFPVAWAAFGYFAWLRMKQPETTRSRLRMVASLGICVGCLVIAFESILISSPWLTYVAAVGMVAAWLLLRAGSLHWATALGLTSLLWITLPLPAGYDDKLIQYLQRQSSFAASSILDCIGLIHLPEGNILELPSQKLFVDEACSGVDSLYALMAICLTIVLYLRQPLPVAVVSLSLVPVWASCGNIVRLVTIVIGIEWFGVDLSKGMPHTILGLLVFTGAFLCDLAFIRFAGALFHAKLPWLTKMFHAEQSANTRPVLIPKALALTIGALLLPGFLFIGFMSSPILYAGTLFKFPAFTEESLAVIRKLQDLPKKIGDWNFRHFEVVERNRDSSMGQFSHLWLYDAPEGSISISTDFPFRGFHLLDICYEGAGWRMVRVPQQLEMSISEEGSSQPSPVYTHSLYMNNDEGHYGYIVYALFQLDGTSIQSQAKAKRGFERFEQKVMEPVSFQIQLMLDSPNEISPETQQECTMRFLNLVKSLKPTFKNLVESNSKD